MTQQHPEEDRLDLASAVRKRRPPVTSVPVRSSKRFWLVLAIAVVCVLVIVLVTMRK